jgi:hypothetical protein
MAIIRQNTAQIVSFRMACRRVQRGNWIIANQDSAAFIRVNSVLDRRFDWVALRFCRGRSGLRSFFTRLLSLSGDGCIKGNEGGIWLEARVGGRPKARFME